MQASKTYLNKKVTTYQAIQVLKRNGILVNNNQAETILSFLYLIANSHKNIADQAEVICDQEEN